MPFSDGRINLSALLFTHVHSPTQSIDYQGRTGGLMDYGDGRLKGTYQFNSKYRKHE
jgi:hypothetical protein